MSQLPKIELVHSEYGTAITVDQKIVGWMNRTVDDKMIVTVGESKKVVADSVEATVFLSELGVFNGL